MSNGCIRFCAGKVTATGKDEGKKLTDPATEAGEGWSNKI